MIRYCDNLHGHWSFYDIRAIFARRHLLQNTALEIFLSTRCESFFLLYFQNLFFLSGLGVLFLSFSVCDVCLQWLRGREESGARPTGRGHRHQIRHCPVTVMNTFCVMKIISKSDSGNQNLFLRIFSFFLDRFASLMSPRKIFRQSNMTVSSVWPMTFFFVLPLSNGTSFQI